MKHLLPWIIILLLPAGLSAQHSASPYSREFHPELETYRYQNQKFTLLFPALLPVRFKDSLREQNSPDKLSRWRTGHFLRSSGEDYSIGASPLLDLAYYRNIRSSVPDTSATFVNGRGVFIEGTLGEKVHFHTWLMENQAFLPHYQAEHTRETGVVSGSGRTKPFGNGGVDYATAGGMVSYTPFSENFFLNFTAGHGKQNLGDGMRSFLLSDEGSVYPFFRIIAGKKGWRYHSSFAILQSLDRAPRKNTPEAVFYRKNATFHSLSVLVHPSFELSFFEGIIWQVYDSTERVPLPVNFYFPLLFGNTLVYGLNSDHNSVAGLNARVTLREKFVFYSQIAADDFRQRRFAWQAGGRIQLKNLRMGAEFNQAAPYTFAHRLPLQSYTHYNQSMGHALGSGFSEIRAEAVWNHKDLFIGGEGFIAKKTDTTGNYNFGSDPLLSDAGNLPAATVSDPGRYDLFNAHGFVAFRLNRTYDLLLSAGARARMSEGKTRLSEDVFLYLKLSTALFARNEDF